jgi:hypothetical protein
MKRRNCIQSVEDQYLCVGHKYIYRNVCFTIAAPVKYLICELYAAREIRQTLVAKIRQLFYVNKSVLFQLACVQVICGSLQ